MYFTSCIGKYKCYGKRKQGKVGESDNLKQNGHLGLTEEVTLKQMFEEGEETIKVVKRMHSRLRR